MSFYKTLRPAIYLLPPETAHNAAIKFLRYNPFIPQLATHNSMLKTNVAGIEFDNPIGMAAGFDKNAEIIPALLNFGFGFVEVGTCTPRPQPGNKKPRMFRLKADDAIINRLGFNNKGCDYFIKNLQQRPSHGIVGANIGKNKDSQDAVDDYAFMLKQVYGLSDYITINISSPNTPGLRDLQSKQALDGLLSHITTVRKKMAEKHDKLIPLFLKIASDTTDAQREEISEVIVKYKIDGLIISNTTVAHRDSLKSRFAFEEGGLSGRPLFTPSTRALKHMYQLTNGKIPLIGVGGIFSAEDAYTKIKSGASLVQIYSAFIYEGFGLVNTIKNGLCELLRRDGLKNIQEAVGVDCR